MSASQTIAALRRLCEANPRQRRMTPYFTARDVSIEAIRMGDNINAHTAAKHLDIALGFHVEGVVISGRKGFRIK